MRLSGSEARRWRVGKLWRAKATIGAFVGYSAVWMGLCALAWMGCRWAGLGDDWSSARLLVSCMGTVNEALLAFCLPLAGMCASVDEHEGCYHEGYYGRERVHGRRDPDGIAVAVSSLLGLAVLALDGGRFFAPALLSWAPSALATCAAGWWLLIDGVFALAGLSIWLGLANAGLSDIFRGVVEVSSEQLRAVEAAALARVAKAPRSRAGAAGAKRL